MTTTKTTTRKAPADRKPKADAAAAPTSERTDDGVRVTIDGISVTLLTAAFDDWELLESLGRLEAADAKAISVLPGLFRRSMSPADYDVVMEHLRDPETKRVHIAPAAAFVLRLFRAAGPNS